MALTPNEAADRAPVLIGVGQLVQRDADPRDALDPVGMMRETTRLAAEDAGLGASALSKLDRVIVPSVFGAKYSNAARLLADALGASEAEAVYSSVGGNGPQKQVTAVAREIAAGRADFALLASAEALDTRHRARQAGISLDWSGGGPLPEFEPEPPPTSDVEARHRLLVPPFVYPLYENALRAQLGRDIDTHRRIVGAMLERFTETAAENPFAWFRTRRSAEEITRPSPNNRMVGFPYTKYMNAILRVDQSAALLITSAARARTLGVRGDRLVHFLGGGDANESPWTLTERQDFHSSNGMAGAFAEAFREARLQAEDVHAFDLYSCFPSAVQIACQTLGIEPDDRRPLTVTGGLPYAGGPGNGYVTHSIATMVKRLRADAGAVGMVTGLGWYFTKHSAGLYSSMPRMELPEAPAEPAPTPKAVEVAVEPSGAGRIETYTVVHDRDGAPEHGIAIGRLEDGRRFVALVDGGDEALRSLETDEGVGRSGTVRPDGAVNRIALA